MKKKVTVRLAVFTALSVSAWIFVAASTASPPPPDDGPNPQVNIKFIPTVYKLWSSSNLHNDTWHTIYNISPHEIKLGDIVVAGTNGINDPNMVQSSYYSGAKIPPFGSLGFSISSISGVKPGYHTILGVTWIGHQDALRLTGTRFFKDKNHVVQGVTDFDSF